MKKYSFFSLIIVLGLSNSIYAQGDQANVTVPAARATHKGQLGRPAQPSQQREISPEVWNKNGYQLTVINQDAAFDPKLKAKMIQTFFEVYPKLSKEYNQKTAKAVIFVIDTAYKGVAAASANQIVFSSAYMSSHPKDIDVVTHEAMHVVQDYGNSVGLGWLTEGIADYARFKYGVANSGAQWSLPAFNAGQSYENSYRIAARFLVWAEKSAKPGLVKALSIQLTNRSYTDQSWKNLTGKTLDELWKAYALNSSI